MVDGITWERLTTKQQDEFRTLEKPLNRAVLASAISDGLDFYDRCTIEASQGNFFISGAGQDVAAIVSDDREVVEALFTEVVQNFGR